MAFIQSFGALQSTTDRSSSWGSAESSVRLYGLNQAYGEIYRSQPNVRICVDFLARNAAQCAPHAFRRISDTDRKRLPDHDLIRWIKNPNPSTTGYRLIESTMSDLGIYFNAYWLKVRHVGRDGRDAIGLVRLPPEQMTVNGGILPSGFTWTSDDGREKSFPLSEIVYFNGYNPLHPLKGISPLETLRQILAEEAAAGEHRESYWRNSARVEGVVSRPKEKPRYSPDQVRDWREQWQAAHAGSGKAGKTVLLQDGETFTATSWSAKDSEYTISGKLRREVCAAEYHIPQPMVGILDHATFTNIREQHKHTYQDTLAPWFEMMQQEIERQLLPECDDQTDVYIEFNIAAKLAGSFEEQAQSLQILVGRPIMTANEGRARLNLPSITDDPSADQLAAQQGGPAGATPTPTTPGTTDAAVPAVNDQTAAALVAPVVQALQSRLKARLDKVPVAERPAAFDRARWNRELVSDLTPLIGESAVTVAGRVLFDEWLRIESEALDV